MCNTIYVVPNNDSVPDNAAAAVESSASPVGQPQRNPFADRDDEPPWTNGSISSIATGISGYQTPHRGVLILVLGILGWAFGCFLVGAFAWVMGNKDLREMDQGRMDPSGRGLTQAGRILGMIQTLLTLVAFVIAVFVAIVAGLLAI
jgi:hypothetical protein